MSVAADPDVVVIGSGPNGLVAAATLIRHGLRVLVLEANPTIGGAVRTVEATLPGFKHDLCSSFYPLFPKGPIGTLPLAEHGLEWCDAARPYGGGTPGGRGVTVSRAGQPTDAIFERAQPGDGDGWRELFGWWSWGGSALLSTLYNPLGHPAPLLKGAPLFRAPRRVFEFAQLTVGSARHTADRFFNGEDARVWFVASALHSDLAPEDAGGGAFAMTLSGLAQQVGMPIPRGGAQAIPAALRRLIEAGGGTVLTDQRARRIVVRAGRAVAVQTAAGDEFPARRAVLATVQPQGLFLDLVGEGELPSDFVKLVRRFRWGSGTLKLDCALSAVPAFQPEAMRGTLVLHLARDVATMSREVAAIRAGVLPAQPMMIAGIQTLVDPSRAPAGQHTLWIETHVPSRIEGDAAGRIEARGWAEARQPFAERVLDELELYAPGVRQLVLGMHADSPDDLHAANDNLVCGDIAGGTFVLDHQLIFRPLPGWFRYKTPIRGLYMGGASTHPGGGVHGACGANAARVLLGDLRLTRTGQLLGDGLARLGQRAGGLVRA